MTTRLTFPASMFSVVCQRCGSTMRKNADSCPNCGADRNAAFGQQRETASGKPRTNVFEEAAPLASAAASASASPSSGSMGARGKPSERVEPGMRSRWTERASERIAQKAAEYRARRAEEAARNAYAESSNDADALPGSERWNQKKTVIAGACALVLLLGAAFYYQLGDSEGGGTPSADHSVSGVIDSKVGSLIRGATDTPATPAAPAVAERRVPAETRPLASGDPLQGVRAALDDHDLATARARLRVFPTQQQGRAEYETLKDELVKRESQRDAALQLARACERTSAWACVQQNAGEALALDGSNIESQAMLERVISHAGWLAPTASAALAKKVPSTTPSAAAAATASKPADTAAIAAAKPSASAAAPLPAQANVAASAKPNVLAQKPTTERRPAQRSAAARQADDEASALEARAEKFARGQAATNAITAATITPPAAPSVATTMTAPAPAQAPRQAAAAPSSAQSAQQPAAKPSAPPVTQAARTPYYLGDDEPQPAAAANPRAASPRAPYYLGDEPPQQTTRPANARGPYYLGEDPPQPGARATVPRPPQSGSQSSSTTAPSTATTQAAVPRPPAAASAQPVAQRSTQSAAATTASPQFATMPAGAHMDSDKTEELERAIKQYGWSGDSAPKPSR
ncbi:zinc ribbon domain-containing protein [Caballeronia sp. NK8]|uniref:zinc ribbon domain-containing protein n=1 Tax=Caballeronia sp. NK8 TaxID=140098 RepID=UPI001BB6BA58|nr:zinc ribbon domain-containing protein [Caballeronia sp. NK8]BCQ25700.1 zinc ribbon domain-containing protein [Caballeronia sp. NK8]